jgi:hypothetical protein
MDIYFEVGQKRVFAGAIEWPGWLRSGRDEAGAMAALVEWGPRFAQALHGSGLGFVAPADSSELVVVERLEGGSGTDFGAPGAIPAADERPVSPEELAWLERLMAASWAAFDAAVKAAEGKSLRKGPRGGGRELVAIVEHVIGGDLAYLTALGYRYRQPKGLAPAEALAPTRQAIREALAAAGRGELETVGPRGGRRWPVRYYVRRAVWHTLDHVGEIEERVEER